jgi:hypothetical protein
LGGGGHPFCRGRLPSRGITLAQAEQQLLEVLTKRIRSRRLAKELMSSPAINRPSRCSLQRGRQPADEIQYQCPAGIRKSQGQDRLLGFFPGQVIEKLSIISSTRLPVREYLDIEIAFVGPVPIGF